MQLPEKAIIRAKITLKGIERTKTRPEQTISIDKKNFVSHVESPSDKFKLNENLNMDHKLSKALYRIQRSSNSKTLSPAINKIRLMQKFCEKRLKSD